MQASRPRTVPANALPTPLAGSTPQDGDLIVALESRSADRHSVRQQPGHVQFSATPRAEAVRLARSFALQHRVNVWYTENGTHRLLEVHRPGLARVAAWPEA